MTRTIALLSLVLAALVALSACSKGYESQKTVEDVKITLSVARYPLVKGDNDLTIRVADTAGKSVADAVVSVRYFMPPMPGMAPMDYTTQAFYRGDGYAFVANVPMEGGWKAEVTVARPGKQAAGATFNLDAR
jgi:hypothetical protein